jgi:hypothetical protein
MRKRFLASLATLATGASLSMAQDPGMMPPAQPGYGFEGIMPTNYRTGPVIPPQMAMSPSEAALMGGPQQGGDYSEMFGGGGGRGVPSVSRSATGWPIIWGGLDFLLWLPKTMNLNYPLATTGAAGTAGVLGQAGTGNLGGGDIGYVMGPGYRITAGFFGGDDRRSGFEGSAFQTGTLSTFYSINSNSSGIPLIARPFVRASDLTQQSLIVSSPSLTTPTAGSFSYGTNTQSFGAELNYLMNLYRTCPDDNCGLGLSVTGVAGFRYANLEEELFINSTSGTILNNGFINTVSDQFRTHNSFYGGQLGLMGEYRRGRGFMTISTKLALGAMHQVVDINGGSTTTVSNGLGGTITSGNVGGLYANSSNIGRYKNDEFAIIPDINMTLGYNILKAVKLSVGYNFIYYNNVARPTSVINPVVNTGVVPTSPDFGLIPTVSTGSVVKQADFLLHGLNFSIVFQY